MSTPASWSPAAPELPALHGLESRSVYVCEDVYESFRARALAEGDEALAARLVDWRTPRPYAPPRSCATDAETSAGDLLSNLRRSLHSAMSRPTCYLLLLLLAYTVPMGCAHQKASVSPEAPEAQVSESKPAAVETKVEPQPAPATEESAAVAKAPRPARRILKTPRPAPTEPPAPAPTPEPAPPAASSVRAFGPGMSKPVKLSGPEPVYTPEALAQRAQGLFIARCIVTREGQVKDCRVLKPVPYMTEAVLEALKQQRYKPATLNGEPVEVEYSFNLRLSPPGGS